MSEPTPRPWRTGEGSPRLRTEIWGINPLGGNYPDNMIGRTLTTDDEAIADARLIVKAVNLHDELVAALRNAEADLYRAAHSDETLGHAITAWDTIREALAKLEATE